MALEGKSQAEVAALAALADGLLSDARTRGPFQRMVKAVNPKVVLPEVEIEDRVAAALKPLRDENIALRQQREQDKLQAGANALFVDLKDQGVVTTRADFTELVTFAAKEGFQTNASGLAKAARHRAAERESAEPTTSSLGLDALKIGKGDADLIKNPTEWARNTANAALNELAKARAGR